jgi:hypothetical protein
MARPRKTGKPKALEAEEVEPKQSPEEFVKEFFPPEAAPSGEAIGTALAQPQQGLPSLDELKKMFKTKSAAIRYLHNIGPEIGYPEGTPPRIISKHLGIRPQHARNVITNPLKRGPNEDWRPKSPESNPPGLQTEQGFDLLSKGKPNG